MEIDTAVGIAVEGDSLYWMDWPSIWRTTAAPGRATLVREMPPAGRAVDLVVHDRVMVVAVDVAVDSVEAKLLLWRLDEGSVAPAVIDLPGVENPRFHDQPEGLFLSDGRHLYALDLPTATPRLLLEFDSRRACHLLSGVAFDRTHWFVATTGGCIFSGRR
jgi:hypothetical protein